MWYRHFGGVKLGAGGLKRAYGQAARHCLQHGQRVSKEPMADMHMQVLLHIFPRHALCSQVLRSAHAANSSLRCTQLCPSEAHHHLAYACLYNSKHYPPDKFLFTLHGVYLLVGAAWQAMQDSYIVAVLHQVDEQLLHNGYNGMQLACDQIGTVYALLDHFGVRRLGEAYLDDGSLQLSIRLKQDIIDQLQSDLLDASSGTVTLHQMCNASGVFLSDKSWLDPSQH